MQKFKSGVTRKNVAHNPLKGGFMALSFLLGLCDAVAMYSLLITLLPLAAAFIGGYVVYRWKQDLHPWLSLSGGLLLGVALLDVLPEAMEMAAEQGIELHLIGWIALGSILFFHAVDRLFGVHAHHEGVHEHTDEDHCHNASHVNAKLWVRASGMVLHRFTDGLAIGSGFLVDPKIGALIAGAMTLHGFADGMSIVAVLKDVLRGRQTFLLGLLSIAVAAPLLGASVALFLPLSSVVLLVLLAWLAGFFLFLSLAELLPQAHASGKASRASLWLTFVGVGIVGLAGLWHG